MTTDVERRARLAELTRQLTGDAAEAFDNKNADAHHVRAKAAAAGFIEAGERPYSWGSAGRRWTTSEAKSAVSGVDSGDFPPELVDPARAFLMRMGDTSILLQLQGLRRVPLRTRVVTNPTAVGASRVVEGRAIPVLDVDLGATQLLPFKHAGIAVSSNEALESTLALSSLMDILAREVAHAENSSLISTTDPDSILSNDASPGVSTGGSIAQISADLRALVARVPAASNPGTSWIMAKGSATYMGTLHGTDGAPAFPGIGPTGGTLLGLPVIISKAAQIDASPSENVVALIAPSDVLCADEQRVEFVVSQSAAIEMDSAPQGDTITPSAADQHLVSLFTAEAAAIKAVRSISWRGLSQCCAYYVANY